jgi:catechol 2,3-dioxygenase
MPMTTQSRPTAHTISIDPATRMGTVRLTVSDLAASRSFYERALGLHPFDRDDGTVAFGPDPTHQLVELHGDSHAAGLDRRATGLFHLAVLLPTRRDLALALTRLAEVRWPLDGASDHLVSEALYLSDPDGNGIEIYRDRPRGEWRRSVGQLEMATLPLDLRDVMDELATVNGPQPYAPTGTSIGHVHLQVAELADTEAFYGGVLGFDVTVRGYPGGLFVSVGGYHHHLGLNTWHSAGGSPPPAGSIGLRSYEIVLPNPDALTPVLERVGAAGLQTRPDGDGVLVDDPSGNTVRLLAATSS